MDDASILTALAEIPAGRMIDMVLDTDTYNEIDDQFALTYALLATERMRCQAVYAAPFFHKSNRRSDSVADGMRKSLEEIERVCERLGRRPLDGIYAGSERFMEHAQDSVPSAARDDLIKRALARAPGDPLYVVAIGAPTNVASALVAEPTLAERIVVVWLGSNPTHWPSAEEFNCMQDHAASATLFDSRVPLVQIPCRAVAQALTTTHAELHEALLGQGLIGDYLCEIFDQYVGVGLGKSKVIWDISAVAWLINPGWCHSLINPSPILQPDMKWSIDRRRHPIREVVWCCRDPIFTDLFTRIRDCAG